MKPLKSHVNKLIQFRIKSSPEFTIARVKKVDQRKGIFTFKWGDDQFNVSGHTIDSFDIVGQKG